MTVLLISLATAASAADVRWSFTDTPLTDRFVGELEHEKETVSVAGQFDYDAINNTVSNLNVTITINGRSTNITNRLPDLDNAFLVFANSIEADKPVVLVRKSHLRQSGNSAIVEFYGGQCRPDGSTCASSNYKIGTVRFSFSDPSAAAPSDNAATVANTIIADSFSRAVANPQQYPDDGYVHGSLY
jgi:hypothetical protein